MLQEFIFEVDHALYEALQRRAIASGTTIDEVARLALTSAACIEDPSLVARLDPFAHARGEDDGAE